MADGGPPRAPGWYPDPAEPTRGGFRWWNGSEWTEALSDSLWTPDPRDPKVYRPVEHSPAVRRAPLPELDLEPDDDSPRQRVILAGAVLGSVLLAGLIVGVLIWFGNHRAAEQSVATEDSSARTTTPASAPPSKAAAVRPSNRPTEAEPDPSGGRLIFDTLPGWKEDSAGAGILPHGQAQAFTTESGQGGINMATILIGDPPEGLPLKGDPALQAETIATWFVEESAKLKSSKPVSEAVETTVDGRKAYSARTQMEYDHPGVKSKHDDVEVTVIDYGANRPLGVVIAVIPETHPYLWKDVEKAVGSLHLLP